MPIYEYKCKTCDHLFDRLVSIKSDEAILCPECGSETKKLISSAGLVFKGSGFYITDYSKKMKKPENSKAGGDKKTKNKDAKPGVSSIPKPTNNPTAQRSLSGVEGSSL